MCGVLYTSGRIAVLKAFWRFNDLLVSLPSSSGLGETYVDQQSAKFHAPIKPFLRVVGDSPLMLLVIAVIMNLNFAGMP